ncbi:DctP family TRAP transporter solute-binding subunit [Marispirochaeta sp.]|uniref:DctP family TRAP transporter solute-binding subunit n=1 Tax=Marispirochaeta sp. TaxID=2038653 RepID=UPI0029C8FC3D|nr:DctP family TRAP transporter solute-binding subunit [Marispirochaeta sp.]
MKKPIVFILCLLSIASVFAEGSKETSSAQSSKPVVLKFGVNGNTTSVEYTVAVRFADTLKDLSGGSLSCEIFPNGQLGNAKEMISQISMNELDAYMEPIGGVSTLIPELSVLEMAYVVRDLDHIASILESDWGQKIQDQLKNDYNIRVLDQTLFGTRQTSSNKPLHSIADYKGLRIRTPNSRGLKDWAEAMGGRPTTIAFSEVYLALKTNSVDAQENPLPTIESMKFYEAQKAIAIDNHVVQDKSILFSEKRWQSLNDKQHEWLKAAAKAANEESINTITRNSRKLIQFFKDQGLEITYPDTAPMRKAMAPYYAKIEQELNVPGLVEKLAGL